MSVLEFISSLKWPLLILILVAFSWWRLRKNPTLGENLRAMLEGRSVRINLGGQELEMSHVGVENAAALAASSDADLAHAALAQSDVATSDLTAATHTVDEIDVSPFRRAAVEELVTLAVQWGWATARVGFPAPLSPTVLWNSDGQPEISFPGAFGSDRRAAMWRRLIASQLQQDPPRPPDP